MSGIGRRIPSESVVFGKNLRRLREQAGLSQIRIGAILNVSFQQVQKYERGANRLPVEKLYILKHFYDVPYARFFKGMESLLRGVHKL